jgi:hypothetical protein
LIEFGFGFGFGLVGFLWFDQICLGFALGFDFGLFELYFTWNHGLMVSCVVEIVLYGLEF